MRFYRTGPARDGQSATRFTFIFDRFVEDDIVEHHSEAALRVIPVEDHLPAVEHAYVLETDVAKLGDQIAGRLRRRGVMRIHLDHVLRTPNAHVVVLDVVHQAAAATRST